MADFTGTAADDVFNAPATVGTAAATTVNSGDTLDGGAGKDTLTITATADNNRSLTGLAVSNIETINLVGANNFGTSTTTTTAPAVAAGARQAQVLDIADLSLNAERQTINFVGTPKSSTAGAYSVVIAGVTVTTASIAADATGTTVASAVSTAISTAAGLAVGATGSLNGIVSSASSASGIVTVNFTAAAGDVAAITAAAGTGATGLTGAPTVTETRASSAEIQSVTLDVSTAGVTGNTLTFANLGSTTFVFPLAAAITADATGEAALALAVKGAIDAAITAGATSVSNIARVEQAADKLTFFYKASAGDVAPLTATYAAGTGAAGFAGTATAATITEVRKGGEVETVVGINGAQYTVKSVVDAGVLSATEATALAAQNASKNALRTAITSQLTTVIGDGVTVGNSDQAGEILLTSVDRGIALPSITATSRDSTTNLLSVDTADTNVANAVKTGASAVAQQVQYTFGGTVENTVDGYNLYINGTNYAAVRGDTSTPATMATALAAQINAVLGTGVAVAAGGVVTITAPVAGTPLPNISVVQIDGGTDAMTLVRSEVRENVAVGSTTTTTALGAASVAASTFVGAEVINLSGASNSTSVSAVAAGQTVGFTGLSSIVSTVGFASTVTNGLLSTTGSSGAVTVTGSGLTSLSLAGTTAGGTTTTLALTEGATLATVDTIKALNVSTSGSTVLNTTGLSALTSVTQTGAGGVTLNAVSTATQTVSQTGLATITTGAGADNIRVTTAVAADLASTTINETVTAVVSTGAGNDRVIVATGGTATNGITTVDLGDGNDTLILTSINTGANTISGGAGDDVFRVDPASSLASTLASTSISGGAGTDVLRTNSATFSTSDYTTLSVNVSSVETLQLTANATVDASRVAMGRIEFFGAGTNAVTEVASTQSLALIRTAVSAATIGIDAVATEVVPTNITASSKGYVFDNDAVLAGNQTVFGENVNLTLTNVAAASTATVNASALTLSVAALGQTTGADSTTDVAAIASGVTLNQVAGVGGSNVQTINATLTSARGSGTRTDNSSTGLGTEAMASLNLGTVTADNTGTADQQGHLQNLTSVTVSGAGTVTINAGVIAAADAKLATINLSGMTAFADLNEKGQEVSSAGAAGGYNNKSTSSVTLNGFISETVLLGGAKDTVVTGTISVGGATITGSSIGKVDTITGFQVVADAANPLVADATRSDVLDLGTAGGTRFTALDVTVAGSLITANAAKMTVTGSTLEAALLQAAALKGGANGTTDIENVVFHFGGDTYVYQDVGANGLTDNDALVRMTGTLNLDLLLTSGVIIA